MDSPPRFLRPTALPAERAIVVGDPGRALFLAQELIESPPPMFSHHRGFWGYSGPSRSDGERLLVQGAGLGATSLNAVIEDLVDLGVERVVRVGTCRVLDGLSLGSLVLVTGAIGRDGVSSTLAAGATLVPDPDLTLGLGEALGDRAIHGKVRSDDFIRRPADGRPQADEIATDLATAALLATAEHRAIRSAAVLVAARDDSSQLDDSVLEPLVSEAGRAALAALSLP